MSEARLELVEPCEHGVAGHCGVVTTWPLTAATNANDLEGTTCPGGSRQVLSVPTDQMVEAAVSALWKASGHTIMAVVEAFGGNYPLTV